MRATPLIASTFTSDGGTMFGLVPKPLWSRSIAADERNRIPQHAHALLLELEDGRLGLVDTGCGTAARFEEKHRELNGLGPGWPLFDELARRNIRPEDIDLVIFSHLHWDHAGGAITFPGDGLAFPNATHVCHALEWADATSGNPLLYKSYPPHIPAALANAAWQRPESDDEEIAPGVRLIRSSGHTRGHSTIRLHKPTLVTPAAEHTTTAPWAVFAGDVCPTRHHLRMVFQTSYDTFPLDTRAWKRTWLPRVDSDGAWLLFDHDPDVFGARIEADPHLEFKVLATLPCEHGQEPSP